MKTKLFAVRIAPNGSIQGDYLAVVEAKSSTEAEKLVDKIDTADMDEFKMDSSEITREIKKTGITRIIVIGGYEN